MEVTHPSTSRQTLLAHQRARSVNTIHCSAISLPGTVTKTVDPLPLSRCFCCFCVNTHGHVRTEQIDRNAKIHSFIHCRHLYSASSSGATQKRSQPQRGRIMLF